MSYVKSRRAEYSESTRDAVLDSAAELFVRQGYPRTSLDEIAAAARVTKGAIYHHFDNKAALMTALVERLELVGNGRLRDLFDTEVDRLGVVGAGRVVIEGFLENCSDPVYGGLVFREAPLALGWEAWQRCMEPFAFALLEDIYGRSVREGMRPGPANETQIRLLVGALGTAGRLLADTPEEDLPRVCGEVRETLDAFTWSLLPGAVT